MKRFGLGSGCLLLLVAVLGACSSSNSPEEKEPPPGATSETSFVVRFDKNNHHPEGTEANPPTKTVKPPAQTLEALPAPPTQPGFGFGGWNEKADGTGAPFTASSPVTAHVVVYALWVPSPPSLSVQAPARLIFSPLEERSTTFLVNVSGFKSAQEAAGITLEAQGPSWLSLQLENSSPSEGGGQRFVFRASYPEAGLFEEAEATLRLRLSKVPEGYAYEADTTLLVVPTHGRDSTRPIPVHKGNVARFNEFANSRGLALHYQLTSDIVLEAPAATPSNWVPIGTADSPFTGSLDGNHHTLSGLHVDSYANHQGLFGTMAAQATVKNLGLLKAYLQGGHNVGSLVGYNQGTVQGCHAAGEVLGEEHVGGLVGYNAGTVQGCHTAVEVIGEWSAGGIAGTNEGRVQNCYATGTVFGMEYIGGMVGANHAMLENGYALGDVSGDEYIGGIAGTNDGGTLQNGYALGSIEGRQHVGGIAGENTSNATLTHCAALNLSVKATSGNRVGRITGFTDNLSLLSNYAFADIKDGDNPTTWPNTPNTTNGQSRTAAQLQTSSGFPAGLRNAPWVYTAGKLPTLLGLAGQTGHMPPHILKALE